MVKEAYCNQVSTAADERVQQLLAHASAMHQLLAHAQAEKSDEEESPNKTKPETE